MAVVFCAGIAQADTPTRHTSRSISWQLQPGESLNGLAALFYPANRPMQQRFVAATKRLNRHQSLVANPASAADHITQITIPDLKYLSTHPIPKTLTSRRPDSKMPVPESLAVQSVAAEPAISATPAVSSSETVNPALLKEYEQLLAKNAEQKQQLEQLNAHLKDLQKIAEETLKQVQAIAAQEALMAELAANKQAAIQAAVATSTIASDANTSEPSQSASSDRTATSTEANSAQPSSTQPSSAQPSLTQSNSAQSSSVQPDHAELTPVNPAQPVIKTSAIAVTKPVKMANLSAQGLADPTDPMNNANNQMLADHANAAFGDLWSEKMVFPLLMTIAALIGVLLIYKWRVKPLSLPTLMFQPSLWPAFVRTMGKDIERPPVISQPPPPLPYLERRASNIERRSPDAGKIQEPAYQAIYNNYKIQEEALAKARELQAALAASHEKTGTTAFGITLAPEPAVVAALAPAKSLVQILAESQQLLRDRNTDAAMELLQGSIDAHPKQSVMPWLYLLEIQLKLRHKKTFGQLAQRMHDTFEAMSPTWADAATGVVVQSSASNLAHIQHELEQIWQNDNTSFSTEVMKEIVVLQEVLKAGAGFPPNDPPAMPG